MLLMVVFFCGRLKSDFFNTYYSIHFIYLLISIKSEHCIYSVPDKYLFRGIHDNSRKWYTEYPFGTPRFLPMTPYKEHCRCSS